MPATVLLSHFDTKVFTIRKRKLVRINGFNFLFKDKKKLGSWSEYLKLREVLIDTNTFHRSDLSLDLGAIAGLLFEIGSQKLVLGGDEYLSEPERKSWNN